MQYSTSPYLPGWEYIPDGEPRVFGDRVYIFGSHDRFNGEEFCLNDYVCWSAPVTDLKNWRYEGVIFRKDQDPDNRDGKHAMWAPDVIQGQDGRYYLYYCLARQWKIGVAVCDSPAGKYEFYGFVQDASGVTLGARTGDSLPFDPGIFIDDDGSIHLYSGQCPLNLEDARLSGKNREWVYHMELEKDMITLKTEPKPIIPTVVNSAGTGFEGHEFFEASSLRKFNGKYYFIYSSVQQHELCWAIADHPDGPYTYGGTLISNGDVPSDCFFTAAENFAPDLRVKNYIGNNHGSVEKIGDTYYIFYHRQTNRHKFSRQACVAKIFMDEMGNFLKSETNSSGFEDYLPGKGEFEVRIACQLYSARGGVPSVFQGMDHPAFTQDEPDGQSGNQYIQNLQDGSTAVIRYLAFEGTDKISVWYRGKGAGRLEIYCNEEFVGQVEIVDSEDWREARTALKPMHGKGALVFRYFGEGTMDFLKFTLA